jgi:hypothetical protein
MRGRGDNGPVRICVALMIVLLAACRDEAPPAPTAQESAQLNEMEAALNAQSENEEGPEANASSPSNSSK